MESRASHTLVGLFTLAALAALFGFVYWFNNGSGDKKEAVRLVFNDKVSGLGRGSSVLFNGLRVGEVTQIDLHPDDPRQIYAVIKVERSTPLRVDTRARIEAQGLAGVVAVQLLGGDSNSPVLTKLPGQSFPTIIAEPSESILETVRTVAKRVDEALGGIEETVKANSGSIGDTIKNAEKFSAALGDNSRYVEKVMQSIGSVAEFIAPFTEKLGAFSEELTETIRSLDQKKVALVIDDVDRFTGALGSGNVRKALKDVTSIAEKLNRAADQVEGVLIGAQSFLNKAAGQDGRSAFDDVSEVAKSLRVLADNLDKRTAEITAEISRFTGAGLRSIETLTSDGRRLLTGFGRTLQGVERDPQSLIFGSKPQLPKYNGSR
ncbi:phospholipid/cholesterol/gamma-HCH transport system substrate-binding protein [Bosea sp. BE125]|uniref:MlaD family protein n=1 Tax=Bosea sp. BE125 TaxID=2817909 RepID=UPI002857D1FF|nr:MlaD family protein [Bosea sp. BE125]MDR6874358.1 phospholipid/cholesterol/gamma-HCH transport system substrate-binding protein [Bosea sp. BE125]